ncbi:MAG TPA: flagellar biosynthesis protein FlhB [Tepidisphaeraceae bacterium]
MADEAGEKTEAPTARRRQEAREKGQIPRSQDLSAAALLLSAVLLLKWFGSGMMMTMRDIMHHALGEGLHDLRTPSLASTLMDLSARAAMAMAPFMLGLMVVAVAINLAQVGLFFSPNKVQPNLAALNPLKGLKKIFGAGQGVVTLLMNLFKLVLITMVAYSAIAGRIGLITGSQQLSHEQIFGLGATIMYDIAFRIAILLLVLSLIDYVYQRYKIEKQLKMTKQEVKEEMKRMEGDPHIKQRRRQIQQQQAMGRIRQDVPTADVIVTNPTHYAIAIKYEAGMTAPKVVAKGVDFLALRIREIAGESGIPILERPPLARALYKHVEVGQEVPEQFYSAVAEILAYVYELNGKAKRRQAVPA